MSAPTPQDAAVARQDRLDALARVVALCDCLWPLQIFRNGDGHDPRCPAHTDLRRTR